MSASQYLEVLKASYDYEPQSEDEIAIKEDQILLLLEKSDDEWWKVKIKDSSDEGEGGLVPAAYVEPANHTSVVKALYDYDAGAPGELSVKEDEELLVFDKDEDWLLVKTQTGGHVGYVPGNYVEEATAEQSAAPEPEPAPAFPRIVIPSSPKLAPQPGYVDPADRVAASKAKANADSIQTWSVSEVDKKGKKKKGTLGIGNGAVFFTSESDKAPVQKWQTTAIESVRIEKNKHVHIDIGGDSTTSLHFNAGSKDAAEAIVGKLKSSAQTNGSTPSRTTSPAADADEERKPNKNGASVRFASSPHSIIPPREPSIDEDEPNVQTEGQSGADTDSGLATVLYDFTADGDDELTVHEGEKLTVLDQDSDEWWKCENSRGQIGVVPASYVELSGGSQPTTNGVTHLDEVEEEEEAQDDEDDSAAREEEERNAKAAAAAEAAERDRKRREREAEERAEAEARTRMERKAKAKAAAEAAEADRKRRERESEEKAEADTRARMERESAEKKMAQQLKKQATAAASQRPSSSASQEPKNRPSSDARRGPPPKHTRVWHDRTGQFQVEAEFLGYNGGKLRLHKTNGVVIEVPAEKMSAEDLRFVEKWKKKSQAAAAAAASAANEDSDDDEPLGNIRKPKQSEPAKESEVRRKAPVKKAPTTDWFEFFLSAGCDVDDCTRYATSFERDKIDESILSDITDQTMRSLGLREGDIIRVKKAIASRTGQPPKPDNSAAIQAQLARDEELARQLQAEEGDGHTKPRRQTTSPAPNLFSNGPGGQLNVRRGRPQPAKSTPPISVDLQSIASASEQITGGRGSPALTTSPVQIPPRASSAAPSSNVSGFDDDAWTPRPSSTKPMTPTPAAANARPPSAPPAPIPPAPVPTPTSTAAAPTATAAPSQTAQPQTQTNSGGGLARTTENDVFEQLARLSALQTRNPAAASPLGNTRTTSAPAASSPATPPVSFQHGLGMGPSPVPIGQHLQTQNTQFQSQQTGAPRGPFAPVPANTSLLQPLIPTTTGFSSFVPTRPASNPPFQPPQPQPMPLQPPFIPSQPTGFPGLMRPQSTGFPGSLAAQPTGFPAFGGGQGFGGNPSFGQLQTQPTGFPSNPNMNFGYNNSAFNQMASPPPIPPVPPLPSSTTNTVTPANIFAQMKSGTFGSDDAPQSADKYDALRPQPTGWGGFGGNMNVYQNGYTGYGR
ncbi:hypothetical protein BD410DRAFT_779523 [Rickenella mellea]|uniref:Actin cytoskeleton-regulatory complex protein SLA1 n=1 Tax=Rickenella mellea TaxID=50990 RepID=A0A4R5XEM0_9AGAM|nr:hypothetical protein BD410DRAFT_779523 [Rickenella mellea]